MQNGQKRYGNVKPAIFQKIKGSVIAFLPAIDKPAAYIVPACCCGYTFLKIWLDGGG